MLLIGNDMLLIIDVVLFSKNRIGLMIFFGFVNWLSGIVVSIGVCFFGLFYVNCVIGVSVMVGFMLFI